MRPGVAPLAAAAVLVSGCSSHHGAPRPAVFQVTVGGGAGAPEAATAFAIGPGRAVTVAHVLGHRGQGARVRLTGRGPARVLAVDERDDLALLAVPGLAAPGSRLGAAAGAATVVVVRNGHTSALAVTIRRSIVARIRTPDGRRLVHRPALELGADVQPGDSGAPVVTPDGRIAGIVFAQSNARKHVAYAVAVSALAALRRRPQGRS